MVDHNVVKGNPPDAPMLVPAIGRIKRGSAKAPRAVTADRGYGEAKVETDLNELGVQHVAIPRKGRPGAVAPRVESWRRFRKLIKWRTGSEGRISHSSTPGAGSAPCSTASAGRDMVRLGHLGPQRHQDRRADRRTRTRQWPLCLAEARVEDLHRTTPTPNATIAPCARLISPRSSPVASPPPHTAGKWGQKATEEVGARAHGRTRRSLRTAGEPTETSFSGRSS